MDNKDKISQGDKLVFLGLVLFFLGLLVGLFVQNMTNPRMALSAHLQGIMNGMFLVILGLIWNRLSLAAKWLRFSFWFAVYGTFANLIAVVVAAITGYGKMMPLAGGRQGAGLLEVLISFALFTLSLCMFTVCGFVLVGYYRYMTKATAVRSL